MLFFWRLNLYSAKYSEPISLQKKSKCWACSTHIYIKWIFDSECIYSFYKDKYECDDFSVNNENKICGGLWCGLWWSVVVCGGLWWSAVVCGI